MPLHRMQIPPDRMANQVRTRPSRKRPPLKQTRHSHLPFHSMHVQIQEKNEPTPAHGKNAPLDLYSTKKTKPTSTEPIHISSPNSTLSTAIQSPAAYPVAAQCQPNNLTSTVPTHIQPMKQPHPHPATSPTPTPTLSSTMAKQHHHPPRPTTPTPSPAKKTHRLS